jgi:hypothetical protein
MSWRLDPRIVGILLQELGWGEQAQTVGGLDLAEKLTPARPRRLAWLGWGSLRPPEGLSCASASAMST